MSGYTLDKLLPSPETPTAVNAFFQKDLQDLLSALVWLYLAGLVASGDDVPPGLAGLFHAAFGRPTHGGLRDLLTWIAKRPSHHTLRGLKAFLIRESIDTGWLGKGVLLRNSMAHPDSAAEALQFHHEKNIVDWLGGRMQLRPFGVFAQESNATFWQNDQGRFRVDPILVLEDDRLRFPHSLQAPAMADYGSDGNELAQRFFPVWQTLRAKDLALVGATPIDFQRKARTAFQLPDVPCPIDSPWRSPLPHMHPIALLVDAGVVDEHIAARAVDNATTWIDLTLENGTPPRKALAEKLGIADDLTPDRLVALALSASTVLALRAGGLSSHCFLDLCRWIADLARSAESSSLLLLVERPANLLEQDQLAIGLRLDDLDQLFRRPPRSRTHGLPAYLWPSRPKRSFTFLPRLWKRT